MKIRVRDIINYMKPAWQVMKGTASTKTLFLFLSANSPLSECRSFRLQVDSPTLRLIRLHDLSRFAYTSKVLSVGESTCRQNGRFPLVPVVFSSLPPPFSPPFFFPSLPSFSLPFPPFFFSPLPSPFCTYMKAINTFWCFLS